MLILERAERLDVVGIAIPGQNVLGRDDDLVEADPRMRDLRRERKIGARGDLDASSARAHTDQVESPPLFDVLTSRGEDQQFVGLRRERRERLLAVDAVRAVARDDAGLDGARMRPVRFRRAQASASARLRPRAREQIRQSPGIPGDERVAEPIRDEAAPERSFDGPPELAFCEMTPERSDVGRRPSRRRISRKKTREEVHSRSVPEALYGRDALMDPFEPGRALPAKSLELWFDYTCPFAYLASTQARELAEEMGVPLVYQPMLLGGVFRAQGTPQRLSEEMGPAKARHNHEDMQRWARRFGVPLRMPAGHPFRSVEALRATLATGNDPRVIDGFYRAYWTQGREISGPEVIADVVASAGHEAVRVAEAITTPAVKDELRTRTERAVSLGIFGAPTWIVDGEHLYWGQDRIAFVRGRRTSRASSTSPPMPRTLSRNLEVFWDFSSPFSYLASTQVDGLAARTAAHVAWRPILLGGLFRAIGTPDAPILTFSEAKRRHTLADLERWAAYFGVPFRFPSRFPTNSLRALRLYLALPQEHRSTYRATVYRAYWAEDRDITDDGVLASCVGDVEIAREALARASTDGVKAELRAATEAAASRGVFGAPTFIVDQRELFWGQDRLELVEDALVGPRS